jgi:hypothetical protein
MSSWGGEARLRGESLNQTSHFYSSSSSSPGRHSLSGGGPFSNFFSPFQLLFCPPHSEIFLYFLTNCPNFFCRLTRPHLNYSMKMKIIFAVAMTLAISYAASADEPTAFDLAKRGDQYVGIQSKDKVVEIRSERSVGSLTPNIWYVVYYDPDATFKAVEVKFGAGAEMEVSHPGRILELLTDEHKPFDPSRLKMDSDRAIDIAASQPLLAHLEIKATQLWLEHGDLGPQWRVRLWAVRLDNPYKWADIGVVVLSATDGAILEDDLHPGNAD